MVVINSKEKIKVLNFREFCDTFRINSSLEGGDDGFDVDLMEDELNKIENQKWLINYIDDNNEGYFILDLIEGETL